MNFSSGKSRRRRLNVNLHGSEDPDLYKYSVQFYKLPPVDTISLEEFESFALDRLSLLRIFENANHKFPKLSEGHREYIAKQVQHTKLWKYLAKSVDMNTELWDDLYPERRKDYISHFILRLAYCRSDELRSWFIKHEVDLFQYRFQSEKNKATVSEILRHYGLKYEPMDEDEKDQVRSQLLSISSRLQANAVDEMEYYKVPFQEVLDLVAKRKAFIKDGFAYVPQNDLVVVVGNVFRMHLSQALAVTARLLPQMEEDDRLMHILKGLNDFYLGQDFGKSSKVASGTVTPEMIEKLSKTSFPMCMRVLHESMREKHHLKHHGRLVYGLFLKAIGLSLDDAQRFFREEFTKCMDSETYEKKGYTYNIRYNYGEEGKKTNFTPYSCSAIITKHAPGPGEVHGCPFKHFDKSVLAQRLQAMNISKKGVDEILDLSSQGHYQMACTKQFELSHGDFTPPQPINHPNYYFEESKKALGDGTTAPVKTEKVRPVTQRAVILPSQASQVDEMDSMSQDDLETFTQVNLEDF